LTIRSPNLLQIKAQLVWYEQCWSIIDTLGHLNSFHLLDYSFYSAVQQNCYVNSQASMSTFILIIESIRAVRIELFTARVLYRVLDG